MCVFFFPETSESENESDVSSDDNDTESEGEEEEKNSRNFTVPTRYLIIDIEEMQRNINSVASCKVCGESLRILEKERSRYGLGCKLNISCSNSDCKNTNATFNSTPKVGKAFCINKQLVLASTLCGTGRSGAAKLTATLNVGTPITGKPWAKATREIESASHELRDASCANAINRAKEQELAFSAQTDCDSHVEISTGFDGSWKRRGWNSCEGIVSAISEKTAEVLDVQFLVRSCIECNKLASASQSGEIDQLEYLSRMVDHNEICQFNHEGSSQSMESAGVLQIYSRSRDSSHRYNPFVGDGDSSAYTKVSIEKPYGPTYFIRKDECYVHIIRRMSRALRKCKADMKKQRVKGVAKFTTKVMQTLVNFYGLAIRQHKGDADGMAKAVRAILGHYQENLDHTDCPTGSELWCNFQKDAARNTRTHRPIKNPCPKEIAC